MLTNPTQMTLPSQNSFKLSPQDSRMNLRYAETHMNVPYAFKSCEAFHQARLSSYRAVVQAAIAITWSVFYSAALATQGLNAKLPSNAFKGQITTHVTNDKAHILAVNHGATLHFWGFAFKLRSRSVQFQGAAGGL